MKDTMKTSDVEKKAVTKTNEGHMIMEGYNMRFVREFNYGYLQAIYDIMEVFEYIQADLRFHKKNITSKLVKELLDCFLKNRGLIRDRFKVFIRWNGQEQKFECVREYTGTKVECSDFNDNY